MPRSRPASSPLSFHAHTGQYYVTRGRKRVYLGADRDLAMEKYHRLALGMSPPEPQVSTSGMSAKELANRFLEAQQANWQNSTETFRSYRHWLERFLSDHPALQAEAFTAEMFAAWKLSLRRRKYSAESINHFLSAVRAIYRFADKSGLLARVPRLRRVRNETCPRVGSKEKPLYSLVQLQKLLDGADSQLKVMLLLGLNCGFGPKDIQDLRWADIAEKRVTLPRSKTGVCQTFLLWPETQEAIRKVKRDRADLIERVALRGRHRMTVCSSWSSSDLTISQALLGASVRVWRHALSRVVQGGSGSTRYRLLAAMNRSVIRVMHGRLKSGGWPGRPRPRFCGVSLERYRWSRTAR